MTRSLRGTRPSRGALLALIALCSPAPLALASAGGNDTGSVFPYPVATETLDNGLEVIVIPMASNDLVAYWSIVRTGSRDEYEPGRTGFAHFFEHMMFRGTEEFPAERYGEILTGIGADTNAYTTDDLTAYHLGFASEDLEQVMQLESDRFMNLDFPKPSFETEAGAVYGEYRKNKTSPFFSVYEALQAAAFEVHTYGHTTMGYERDIKNMPGMYDYSRTFFERYYRPENVVLVIAGDVDSSATFELARHYYGDWEPGYVAPQVPEEPEQKSARHVSVDYEGRSLPIVWLAFKGPRFDPSDRLAVAADLLAELAFGETSDIYADLVLSKQSIEFIQAEMNMNRDPGLFQIITRIKDPQLVTAVRQRIDATLERYRNQPPDPERLAGLKSRLRYGFLMNLDTPDHVASALARIVAITGGVQAIDDYYQTVADISPEDVHEAARRLLDPDRSTLAVLEGGR